MKINVALPFAIVASLLTLLGYFIPLEAFHSLQSYMLRLAIFLAAFALIAGVWNLTRVHIRRSVSGKAGWGYSIFLVLSMWLTFVVVLFFDLPHEISAWIVQYVQIPLEASLAALVAFVLLAGGARLLYKRPSLMAVVFLVTALLILAATIPLPALPDDQLRSLEDARSTISSVLMVLASAGGRGILIGMALGAAATGIRVMMGFDRPYER